MESVTVDCSLVSKVGLVVNKINRSFKVLQQDMFDDLLKESLLKKINCNYDDSCKTYNSVCYEANTVSCDTNIDLSTKNKLCLTVNIELI